VKTYKPHPPSFRLLLRRYRHISIFCSGRKDCPVTCIAQTRPGSRNKGPIYDEHVHSRRLTHLNIQMRNVHHRSAVVCRISSRSSQLSSVSSAQEVLQLPRDLHEPVSHDIMVLHPQHRDQAHICPPSLEAKFLVLDLREDTPISAGHASPPLSSAASLRGLSELAPTSGSSCQV